MKILHATGAFLPTKGGGPYFVHHLTKALERRGHDCHVVAPGVSGCPSVETVSTTRPKGYDLGPFPFAPAFPLALDRAIRAFEPDIVHTHYPLPYYPEVSTIVSRVRQTPVVTTCHGALEMDFESLIGVVGTVYNRSLLHVALAGSEALHVSNEHILGQISLYDRYRDKTHTIPMGVDTDWFHSTAASGPPPFDETPSPTILFVGSFRRYKGLEYLVDAFSTVNETFDATLVLLGDGPRKEGIQRLVNEHGVAEAVEFVDHVDDADLRRAYTHTDVFVLPSPSIEESLGLVALEAMAMGLPTVVTAGSGIGRLLQDHNAGVVVKPYSSDAIADALTDLLSDEGYLQEQRTAGERAVAESFAWRVLVERYESFYRDVLD